MIPSSSTICCLVHIIFSFNAFLQVVSYVNLKSIFMKDVFLLAGIHPGGVIFSSASLDWSAGFTQLSLISLHASHNSLSHCSIFFSLEIAGKLLFQTCCQNKKTVSTPPPETECNTCAASLASALKIIS